MPGWPLGRKSGANNSFHAYHLGTVLLSFHAQQDVDVAEVTFTVMDEKLSQDGRL